MPNQIQLGGTGNIQIQQQINISLSTLLNQTEDNLKQRSFACTDVKNSYVSLLAQLSAWIHNNNNDVYKATAFMMYPFKTLPEEGAFQNNDFIEALLETLTLIAFSDISYAFEEHHLNLRINGSQTCGMYYHSSGQNDLIDSFVRLIKSLKDRNTILPSGMIFIILRCIGRDSYLEPEKIKNILNISDILGNDPYIRPLQVGSPKCVNLTSYIINECQNLDEAKSVIRGVLSVV